MQSVHFTFVALFVTCSFGAAESWEAALLRSARIPASELSDVARQARDISRISAAGSKSFVMNGCPTCSKSYAESCPSSWEADEDGVCHAPSGYTGFCAHSLSFGGLSVESKIVAEISCSMCWPCRDDAPSDVAPYVE